VVDDFSTDLTREIIKREIGDSYQIRLVEPEERGYPLGSLNLAIESAKMEDEDVIAVLDGDDWFARKESLEILAKTYEETNCSLTYGSYVEYPTKVRGKFAKKVPQFVIESKAFRQSEWMTSHMRTFKYKLWKNIKKEDLCDEDGKYYKRAGDLAAMYPMLEMAGDKIEYVEDVVYVYNRANPLNEDKVDHSEQLRIEAKLRQGKPYNILEEE
tara:strand:- start:112 stop:750 length:639 start_codon:yes stop_codon:yes gene_type:complete